MTPRPNCAGRPVMVRSVVMVTSVRSSASAFAVAFTVMDAVDPERAAFPDASITARCAASSASTIRADPL